jgi:hypothetical protein
VVLFRLADPVRNRTGEVDAISCLAGEPPLTPADSWQTTSRMPFSWTREALEEPGQTGTRTTPLMSRASNPQSRMGPRRLPMVRPPASRGSGYSRRRHRQELRWPASATSSGANPSC